MRFAVVTKMRCIEDRTVIFMIACSPTSQMDSLRFGNLLSTAVQADMHHDELGRS